MSNASLACKEIFGQLLCLFQLLIINTKQITIGLWEENQKQKSIPEITISYSRELWRRHMALFSASLAFVREIYRSPVDSPDKEPVLWIFDSLLFGNCRPVRVLPFMSKLFEKVCHDQLHTLLNWGRVTQICVSKLIIIGSYNGLSPDRCQAIIWTNAVILLIGPYGTNFSEF